MAVEPQLKGGKAEGKGFLLVLMQPSPSFEEEFNSWYDTEHVPERLAVAGFETARRYICVSGWPRYLALYDLANITVLDSPAYQRVSGSNSSPWTRRVLSRVYASRHVGVQRHPGHAVTTMAPHLLLLRFRGLDSGAEAALATGLRAHCQNRHEVAQWRLLSATTEEGIDYFGVLELKLPLTERIDIAVFGPCAGSIDLANTYARC